MEQAAAQLGRGVLDSILTAAMADPDAMRRFVNDISPPAEPVDDYITEVDTRCALFEEYRAICQDQDETPNAAVFAVLMVAPISKIRIYLDGYKPENSPTQPRYSEIHTLMNSVKGIRTCTLLFPCLTPPTFFRLVCPPTVL